ncbi:MAG TPA: transglycosylase SLT domain-containing protein [Bryobacteraceae bacterium]
MLRWLASISVASAVLAASDPLADLKAAEAALEARQYATAAKLAQPLAARLPKLADYSAWILASAEFGQKNDSSVPKILEAVWKNSPSSPLAAKSYLLAAEAYRESGSPSAANNEAALEILRKNYASLPQPKGDLALASAFDAVGDEAKAASYFQRVYYGFPTSAEASSAGAELTRLKTALGDGYLPPTPAAMLGRAAKLVDGGQIPQARRELEALVHQLSGADRDLARVRLGVASYQEKQNLLAFAYLRGLSSLAPEADAERLYYLLLCARRLNRPEEVATSMEELDRLHPQSNWRLQALLTTANPYLIANQPEAYEPLYRACYETFSKSPEAADCHWKVTWEHYLRRQPDAGDLLREQLRLFPASNDSDAALYFLGRLAEAAHDSSSAFAYYAEVAREYPNTYFATQARDRLRQLGAGASSPAATQFLNSIAFPRRMRVETFEPSGSAALRIERAKLLKSEGLDTWAREELRFGADTQDQPHLMAMELASLDSASRPDQAVRYILHYVNGYLSLPIESAPVQFWTLAFPLPFRADMEHFSKQNGLDLFLVAALVRQESLFDPKIVSYADARGLTQIMPATGRELSRRLKLGAYTTAKLFQPSYNLQLGTYYLQSLTEQTGGRVEAALAAYNAGLSRARTWLGWADFQEPAEFIETVPFEQTRTYIQTVLRNADVYRRVYGIAEPVRASSASQR